jgi:hypothetical protein
MKLHQVLAVAKNIRTSADRTLVDGTHALQRTAPMTGISRKYQPLDEEGERLPPESTKVQTTVPEIIGVVKSSLARLFDITASQEWTNCGARADVIVHGEVLLPSVPANYLLFLGRKLTELRAFAARIPTLDPSESWTFDSAAGLHRTDPVQTVRTKKIPRNHVKAEATPQHPAQVEMWYEDKAVGSWEKIMFSGMMEPAEAKAMILRIQTLQEAVKLALSAANSTEAVEVAVGERLLGYLFG